MPLLCVHGSLGIMMGISREKERVCAYVFEWETHKEIES